jgi:uncharacterized membrane protein YeaQ/YmgE (transglycosylase-associated protein family)
MKLFSLWESRRLSGGEGNAETDRFTTRSRNAVNSSPNSPKTNHNENISIARSKLPAKIRLQVCEQQSAIGGKCGVLLNTKSKPAMTFRNRQYVQANVFGSFKSIQPTEIKMDFVQLADYANLALTWIGFGTVVGLAAKAVMPGRDPGGAIATVLMGIAGTLIGCAVLQYFSETNHTVQPISLEGFAVGSGGALVLLIFYKVLGGYWFIEGEQSTLRSRRRRKRYRTAYDD